MINSDVVISVENLSKEYRLGIINHGTLRQDLQSWWARLRGHEDPNSPLAQSMSVRGGNNRFLALDDLTFEVRQGELIGIIGRNGAGKSTLLKVLSRITAPTRGTVRIRGRVASLLEVGTGFHPELTGRENIFLNGAILGMKKTEISRKLDAIISFAEIERFVDTPVKRYSSGMYVRLAFAVAAHLESEILIVDEVLAVGDAQFQKKCLGKMEEVSVKDGRTVLFVSHNMGVISQLCTKAMLLRNGTIDDVGDVSEVIMSYTSNYSSDSVVDLTSLQHGGKNEYASLCQLSLYDESYTPCSTFSMGKGIIAEITLECRRELRDAELGLKISNYLDQPLHFFVSTWEGMKIDLNVGIHTFQVCIPEIMLLPGKYFLGAWISRDGEWSDDNVSGITMIEICSEDVTGNMKRLHIRNNFEKYSYGGCASYHRSEWKLK